MILAGVDTNWLEQHMLTCPSKKFFLIDCPGCGLQRSVIAIFKGDFLHAWHIYPPGIFTLATLLFLVLHLLFPIRYGAVILKTLFIITVLVILVNYIYKVTNHQLI